MNKLSTLGSGLAAGLILLANPAVAGASEPSIEGAWMLETTIREDAAKCADSPVVGVGLNPFQAMNVFHRGGTMSEFGTRSPPSFRGPGFGVWKRTGERTYRSHNLWFNFDANGLPFGTIEFTSNLRVSVNGKKLTGIARVLGTDPSGNQRRFCATMTAERIGL